MDPHTYLLSVTSWLGPIIVSSSLVWWLRYLCFF